MLLEPDGPATVADALLLSSFENSTLLAMAVVPATVMDLPILPILIRLGARLSGTACSLAFPNPNSPLPLVLLPRLPSLLPELASGTLVNARLIPGRRT